MRMRTLLRDRCVHSATQTKIVELNYRPNRRTAGAGVDEFRLPFRSTARRCRVRTEPCKADVQDALDSAMRHLAPKETDTSIFLVPADCIKIVGSRLQVGPSMPNASRYTSVVTSARPLVYVHTISLLDTMSLESGQEMSVRTKE